MTYTVSGVPGTQVATFASGTPPIQGGSCSVFAGAEKGCIAAQGNGPVIVVPTVPTAP